MAAWFDALTMRARKTCLTLSLSKGVAAKLIHYPYLLLVDLLALIWTKRNEKVALASNVRSGSRPVTPAGAVQCPLVDPIPDIERQPLHVPFLRIAAIFQTEKSLGFAPLAGRGPG